MKPYTNSTTEQYTTEVTVGLVSLIEVLHTAKKLYIAESMMAMNMNRPGPALYWDRCEDLFTGQLAEDARSLGLKITLKTFEVLMAVKTEDGKLDATAQDMLPKVFSFDSWFGIQRLDTDVVEALKVIAKSESKDMAEKLEIAYLQDEMSANTLITQANSIKNKAILQAA